ncbi:Protein IQ-DOMAIN 15 [Linum grandiflorum]
MGKIGESSSSSWFTTVKKAFMSPKKQKQPSKRREEEDDQNQEQQRSEKRRWINFTRNHYHHHQHQQPTLILQHCGISNNNNVATSNESRVLAVAMATTAAAHAAIATAQAAVEAARLASNHSSSFFVRQRHFAAVSIQTAFRAYLARRALRALKGVVKLQALVRGQNMRRRTQLTLHGIQSLLRIQSRVLLHQRNRRLSFEKEREAVRYASEGDNDDRYLERRWIVNQHHLRNNCESPRYMAATESARSRIRPKQRPYNSPIAAKKRLSFPGGGDCGDKGTTLPRMSSSSSTDGYVSSSSLFGSSQ